MKKLSIDRIGKRGSIVLLIVGILCLAFGIFLQIRTIDLPPDAIECDAVITAFETGSESQMQTTSTLVSYEVDGKTYTNIPLGQYEGSWRVGDKVRICCSKDDNTKIWTRTMQYRGIFYILFAASFLFVAIYKLLQFRKIKGQSENETDLDKSGIEKFRLSSGFIPLAAGIPLTVTGILYWIMEHSVLGIIIFFLGTTAVITGIVSIFDFIRFKRSQKASEKAGEAVLSGAGDNK